MIVTPSSRSSRSPATGVRALALAAFCVAATGCGSKAAPPSERTGVVSSHINGGDSENATSATTLPEMAVGQVKVPFPNGGPNGFGTCSGTLILRNVVLTAAHCFVTPSGFVPENTQTTFYLPVPSGQVPTFTGTSYAARVTNLSGVESGSLSEGDTQSDLAVVFLTQNVGVSALPALPAVYTGGDFLDRVNNFAPVPPATTVFFQTPWRVVGFDGTLSPNLVRTAGSIININFTQDCGFLGFGPCSGYYIEVDEGGPSVATDSGDSGGPITFVQDGTTVTVFGVIKGVNLQPFGSNRDLYSPTWDNGNGNGTWLTQFIPDADHDGVLDSVDNCAPAKFCPDNPARCANSDQADDDGDGVGDVCDNCTGNACRIIGFSASVCFNPGQENADGDGLGDVCDLCPVTANDSALNDSDSDGVGDACDNCMQPNGYAKCASSADCHGALCLSAGQIGTCASGPNQGRACGRDDECVGAPCTTPLGGRCAIQLDDLDGDGIGGLCDTCPFDPDIRVLANSNGEDEQRESATPLGDKCDPVPLTVSKPVVVPLGPSAVGFNYFASTAGLGQNETQCTTTAAGVTTCTGPNASAPAIASYKYCPCIDASMSLMSRATCLQQRCPALRSSFSGDRGEWIDISLAALPGFTFPAPPPASAFTLGLQTSDTYTGDVVCDDSFSVSNGSPEACRIGSAQRTLIWATARDVAAGRVVTDTGGTQAGLLLSHVLQTTSGPAFVSARDSATQGNLRNDYEYVRGESEPTPPPGVPIGSLSPSTGCVACEAVWRPDYVFDPSDFRTDPAALRSVSFPSRILPVESSASFAALGSPGDPVYDVTTSLSQGVKGLLGATGLRFLSPSEPGARGTQGGSPLVFAAMPAQWRQSAVRPIAVVGDVGRLETAAEAADPPPPPTRFVPSDRDGAGALLSARRGSVYLIGGHMLKGVPTGEVWNYDIGTDIWKHIFLRKTETPEPRPGDVQAAAYDDLTQRIVVLDVTSGTDARDVSGHRLEAARGDHGKQPKGPPEVFETARVLLLDLEAQSVVTLASTPKRADTTSFFGLAADDDGTFVLVKQAAGRHDWVARRFRIAKERGRNAAGDGGSRLGIECLGRTEGRGSALDVPIHFSDGIKMPVVDEDGVQRFVTLSPSKKHAEREDDDDGIGCTSR
jgi:hypothetical protein